MRKKGHNLLSNLMQRLSIWFFFIFFQVVFTNSQNQTCNSADLNALQRFLRGLDSGMISGWSINASSSDCCRWFGVSCENSTASVKRVIGLDLQNRSLKGSLSDSLADLDQLQWLNLSFNLLEGVLPSQLFNLSRLHHLDLSTNKFSGTIPPDVYLPSIKVFNVSNNAFSGKHPLLAGSTMMEIFDISLNEFTGLDAAICNSSFGIRVLRFSLNGFTGNFPLGFGNCASLEELYADLNGISGNLPDDLFKLPSLRKLFFQENQLSGMLSSRIGNLSNLEMLDLSYNSFLGKIPNVFDRLTKLNYLSLQSNKLSGDLPSSLSNLPQLRLLNLKNNLLSGEITINCMGLNQLNSLNLGTNFFSGSIPYNLSQCVGLRTLNLARNNLTGEIPDSFKNLTFLAYLSLSNNSLSNIYSALVILQEVKNLTALVLTRNFHDSERIPVDGIRGFQNLQLLAIANCGLLGSIPPWLSNLTKLNVLDLSWNHLEGSIPSWLGNLDSLFYLDLSNNSLSGEIPGSLTQMKSLISGSTSQFGPPTEDFSFFVKRNVSGKGLQYNQVSSFPPSLILCQNNLVGSISPGFGNLKRLYALDLSKNGLSGTIPDELSGLSELESLDLSHNYLTGSIPSSLNKLNFLSSFRVAYNNLSGPIPVGGQFSTFSSSDFEGNPGLCGFHLKPCAEQQDGMHTGQRRKNKAVIIGLASGIGLGTFFLVAFIYFLVSRTSSNQQEDGVKVAASSVGDLEAAESRLVLLFHNMNNNSELCIGDILKSTNHFDQSNIIGCGGFGLVYKAILPDGRKIAIKRLSGDYFQMEREFQAEIETLSRAQHRNLVLLQGYCRIGNDRLLIYSYMQNGSLDYWLHEKPDGGLTLDWGKRLHIAQGSARGLAYLHQSCDPHILHRDIKSSNILLDENFEAHLADFGLARLILPYDTHVTTDLVGTLGYIPPEYGQSSVATFKGDVYSFGVVLLELLTGKRPVDVCKPKGGRELISWVLQMKKDKRESEVFDPHIYDKSLNLQLIKVLEIACICLSDSPKLRPFSKQLVAWLDNVGTDEHLPK
ncbi:phytosulfokine receptor 1-like [Canna indica]|uniref:non-specific serine/threonine protein kinase n=1 Tax=Canna indica TaxID=4628 RepID=A0AAQ3KIA5_9LILI|nr:phytosulfokine receptor 1-like [Canna indica]